MPVGLLMLLPVEVHSGQAHLGPEATAQAHGLYFLSVSKSSGTRMPALGVGAGWRGGYQ
jgi:hypothetical protein